MSDKSIINSYRGAFILEKTKLVRIIDVIEKSFQKITSETETLQKSFLTKFNNGKEAKLISIDEVFNLDNGVKNKVTELKIGYKNDDNNILVHFDGDRRIPVINIVVESDNIQWSNESFAEIEEQIERTKQNGWIYTLKKAREKDILLLPLALIILLTSLKPIFSSTNVYLDKDSSIYNLLSNVDSIKTQEDKINFIYNATKEITLEGYKHKELDTNLTFVERGRNFFSNWKIFLIIIPILIIIGTLWFLISKLYWLYGFIWGDMEEAYKKSVEQRKTVWNILIGSLILGILSNLFVFGLTGIL